MKRIAVFASLVLAVLSVVIAILFFAPTVFIDPQKTVARTVDRLSLTHRTLTKHLDDRQIGEFRQTLEDIASTSEGLYALSRFNAGAEPRALALLDRLRAARARSARSDSESAAEARLIAALALEARDRGKVGTASAIARFEALTYLDPHNYWNWVELNRLYMDAGRLADAHSAAERAFSKAHDYRAQSVSLSELGHILQVQRKHQEARERFQTSVEIDTRLARTDPSSVSLQRDLAVSTKKLGGILLSQQDFKAAQTHYQDSLEIDRRLAEADPSSVSHQCDLATSNAFLGIALKGQGDLEGAQARYLESIEILKSLAEADPSSIILQRNLSSFNTLLGNLHVFREEWPAARALYQDNLEINRRLADTDPSSAVLRINLAWTYNRLVNVLVNQDDRMTAMAVYLGGLEAVRQLNPIDPRAALIYAALIKNGKRVANRLEHRAKTTPAAVTVFKGRLELIKRMIETYPSSGSYRDILSTALWNLARLRDSGVTWREVVEAMEDDLKRRGRGNNSPGWFLEQARESAAREAAGK